MLNAMSVPQRTPDCRLERLENEALLFCPATASTVFLNETAALVWDLCDGTRTVSEIVDLLRAAYPESADRLAADVEQALGRFADCGAMRLE
jgi:hypothetical protein